MLLYPHSVRFFGEQDGKPTSIFGTGEGADFFRIGQDFNRRISKVEIDFGGFSSKWIDTIRCHIYHQLGGLLYHLLIFRYFLADIPISFLNTLQK